MWKQKIENIKVETPEVPCNPVCLTNCLLVAMSVSKCAMHPNVTTTSHTKHHIFL